MGNAAGHTVLVTGATAGFGAAMARKYAADGAKVIITGRRADRLAALKDEIGDNAHTLNFDIQDQDAVFKAIESLPADFSDITILVNNAGLAMGMGSADTADMNDWNTMVATNISGLIAMTGAVLPGMVARNRGHIVNLGSVAGTYPYPGGNVYGATKAFVHQFSLNLRADLVDKNVRVTCVEPGMAETEFSVVRFDGDESKAADVYKGMKAMTPEDVAEAIYWATMMPAHVNINTVEMMATVQAFGPFSVHRE
ncbi:MAG: SDR family NAD(P)-dependent oxidoreductase [Alphaproteobacteria bacterium]|jgi:3-hydroxy acid dehydrogenase / malonic semialdehyde reductase|nr:SDR family NAD(P)-dependent oxidoreductase [Alphaproteobacteria bacterium]